ncbi:MAG: hypothetical protein ACYTE8_11995, partial [Planctomycetota bacterium]
MEKRKDIVDKALEALKKERVPTEPPSRVVDATHGMLKEAQEELEAKERQHKLRISEVIGSTNRFGRIAAASGIAAAFILCVIFFAKIAEQPKPKLVEGDKSQATEVV